MCSKLYTVRSVPGPEVFVYVNAFRHYYMFLQRFLFFFRIFFFCGISDICWCWKNSISGIIFDPIKGSIWAAKKYTYNFAYFGWFFLLVHLSVDAWKKWAKINVLSSFSLFWVDRSWLCAPQKPKKNIIRFHRKKLCHIFQSNGSRWMMINDQFK